MMTPVKTLRAALGSSCLPDPDNESREHSPLNETVDSFLNVTQECIAFSPDNKSTVERKRGRPRKNESIGPRFQSTPVQGSSCLTDIERSMKRKRVHPPLNESVGSWFNTTQDVGHVEDPPFSPNNESIVKRQLGRPGEESLILDSDTPGTVAAKRGRGRPRKVKFDGI